MSLADATAIVTGAASGFGRATTRVFAERGANVVGVDVDEDGLEVTGSLVEDEESPGTVVTVQADVTDGAQVAGYVEAAVDEFGQLDVLHNNAGIIHPKTPIEDIDEADWDRVLDVNLKGIFLGAKHAVPHLQASGGGAIVNTASISGSRPRDQLAAYSASKGGAVMLTKGLAVELADDGIRVNSISPVASPTNLLADFTDQQLEAFAETVPLGRLADPDDVAHAAAFLADDEQAGMITGVDLPVDGGRGI